MALFNPEMYQGWGNTRKYFEGWYFKVVNAQGTKAFAFIPGISMDTAGNNHAFIQVLDGSLKQSEYHPFSASLFKPSGYKFELSLGDNFFSPSRMVLDLPSVKGTLDFSGTVPWPKPWYSPGIMGPYAFAPFMECSHGIVSMDHSINGSLTFNNEVIDFTGGRGYIEKDWGHSFPSAYLWMQSNRFETEGISFKASVARIPWMTGSFNGFIAGLWNDNKLTRFTTYNGSKLRKLAITGSAAELELENRSFILSVRAPLDQATGLAAPVDGMMNGRIEESMTAVITVNLRDRKTGKSLFSGEGRNASIERSGDTSILIPRRQS
jgi:hypothetical protein